MPYRRLPNTDQARIRALKAAIEKADAYDNPYGIPFSFKVLGGNALKGRPLPGESIRHM